ncbi:hypothetical protein GIB67_015389 [Kingdonia uniflora]|uniref:Uncharacterized protein n=1 Tax=Kingdonia uniflora TaxID=39325 RepID=A0A7J7KYU7_9MAGN|nr:hypothetical protein GIB67_015389 [Kingdonia uniflora]
MLYIVDFYASFARSGSCSFPELPSAYCCTGKALLLPSLQESEEAEYEVIVDIIFEENSSVFGQRGVFFDERLISTKIKYPRIILYFAY